MNSLANQIKQHPFFKDVADQSIEKIASFSKEVKVEAGEFIFRSGEEAGKFYLIQQGEVIIEIAPTRHSDVSIQSIREGEVLGWSWLIPPFKWQFDAKAVELTKAIAIDAQSLRAFCKQNHAAGYQILTRMIQIVAQRLQAARTQFWDIYKMHYFKGNPY